MQVHGSTYRSISQCARSLYRTEGLTAFYVSYPTTLCMTIPFTATQFMAYESLSKFMNPQKDYDPFTHCMAGGLAGAFAAGITTPLDVIKTLLQTRGLSQEAEVRNVRGLFQAANIIKRQYGWSGFFRGLRPRIITTMPSTAICWYVHTYPHPTWHTDMEQDVIRDGEGLLQAISRIRIVCGLVRATGQSRNTLIQFLETEAWSFYVPRSTPPLSLAVDRHHRQGRSRRPPP